MKIDAIKPYDDKPLQEKVAAIKPYDDTALKASIPKAYDDKPIKEELVTFNSKLTTLETENKNLKETVTKQKTDFDNLLSAADTRIKEEVAKRETELEETRKKVAEQEKVIRETVEKAEKAQVLSENTESKLKGNFKGKANDPTKQDKPDLTYKPAGGK
jgi:chromosome segregation ATPase